jgi:flavin-dependent dehydrogenase
LSHNRRQSEVNPLATARGTDPQSASRIGRNPQSYDVIVIGAGPAGSAVSIFTAQRGYRILLLEKSRFPREKLCGEFITPECLNLFERLDVQGPMLDAGARTISKWIFFAPDGFGIEIPIEWIAHGHQYAISLSRAKMDRILLDRAREAGADVREGFHVSPGLSYEKRHWIVDAKTDGESTERFRSRVVIDASSRNGVFSEQRRAFQFKGSRLFACKVHLRGVESLWGMGELFFFRDGYGGISEVEDGCTNLCFLTTEETLRAAKGDREKLLDLTIRSNPASRKRLKNAVIDGQWLGTGPINYGRSRSIPGVFAIGDSRAFIDPFTGSGIFLALTGGELAADVIHEAFDAGIDDTNVIIKRYDEIHRAKFGFRFRACALLRSLALKPATRNIMFSLLSRHHSLMRLLASSTRQSWHSIVE